MNKILIISGLFTEMEKCQDAVTIFLLFQFQLKTNKPFQLFTETKNLRNLTFLRQEKSETKATHDRDIMSSFTMSEDTVLLRNDLEKRGIEIFFKFSYHFFFTTVDLCFVLSGLVLWISKRARHCTYLPKSETLYLFIDIVFIVLSC